MKGRFAATLAAVVLTAGTEPGAVFGAFDHHRDLADDAPPDLRDEWTQVIRRIEALEAALDEATVQAMAGIEQQVLDVCRTPLNQ